MRLLLKKGPTVVNVDESMAKCHYLTLLRTGTRSCHPVATHRHRHHRRGGLDATVVSHWEWICGREAAAPRHRES